MHTKSLFDSLRIIVTSRFFLWKYGKYLEKKNLMHLKNWMLMSFNQNHLVRRQLLHLGKESKWNNNALYHSLFSETELRVDAVRFVVTWFWSVPVSAIVRHDSKMLFYQTRTYWVLSVITYWVLIAISTDTALWVNQMIKYIYFWSLFWKDSEQVRKRICLFKFEL